MLKDETLKSILKTNPNQNISILGFFFNYPVEDYMVENNSALVLGKSEHLWVHIASSSANELSSLLARHNNKVKYYFSVEDWMIPLILDHGTEEWRMLTYRYILDPKIHTDSPHAEVIELDRSYANYIYEKSNYKEFISVAYIEDRLNRGISAAIMENNKLVAWGFTHDDNALGFLHVLEDYRRKGYGRDILLSLIKKKRNENMPVIGNVIPGNTSSVALLDKLGFKFDRNISWIKLK
ncbi:MAG: GNAT family N-acetyltransferase [Bacteroidales bacterium]|nr:GNAT family N-acetyltransferase [Bacteroidales bacterium]MCF8457739.1 GNAT family N-acetyltransferase [Bacteroidales bacterium]